MFIQVVMCPVIGFIQTDPILGRNWVNLSEIELNIEQNRVHLNEIEWIWVKLSENLSNFIQFHSTSLEISSMSFTCHSNSFKFHSISFNFTQNYIALRNKRHRWWYRWVFRQSSNSRIECFANPRNRGLGVSPMLEFEDWMFRQCTNSSIDRRPPNTRIGALVRMKRRSPTF